MESAWVTIDKLEAKNAKLRELREGDAKAAAEALDMAQAKIDALEAENARLRKALEEYGIHDDECALLTIPPIWPARDQPDWKPPRCDCGYAAALAAVKPKEDNSELH